MTYLPCLRGARLLAIAAEAWALGFEGTVWPDAVAKLHGRAAELGGRIGKQALLEVGAGFRAGQRERIAKAEGDNSQ